MRHEHDYSHGTDATMPRLRTAFVLASSYMAAEVIGGVYTGSLALLADAGHMLTDASALALALSAVWMARRPSPAQRTFGNHRAEILAATLNGLALLAIAIFVIAEAAERWSAPPDVLAGPMLLVATGGLFVNIAALLILRGGKNDSLNVRGAFLHVMADALGSVGAMASGVLIWAFDWRWADPLASMLIAVLVLGSAIVLLRQTVKVLMQAAPDRLVISEVQTAMEARDGVVEVHDLHAWTLASGKDLLTAHVVIVDVAQWPSALRDLNEKLRDDFGIGHVTLQPETPGAVRCECAFVARAVEPSPPRR